MEGETTPGLATIYRVGYVCLLVVSLASFFSLFEPDSPRPKRMKTKRGSSTQRMEEQNWPMLLTFASTTKKKKADTVGVSEGLVGGEEISKKTSNEEGSDPQVITKV